MYFLLVGIHTIFIICSHILWYYLLEGIFILLLLFFLLYFSPIFFLNKETDIKKFTLPSFSPQKSISIPLILVYIALYFLIFALTESIQSSINLHIYILIWVHVIFFWYMMSFMWKQDIFFDIARFHLIFTYITILSIDILGCFDTSFFSIPVFILAVMDIILSMILFSVSREEHLLLFQSFLTIGILTGYIFFFLVTHIFSFPVLIAFIGLSAMLLFTIMPRYRFFEQFLQPSKVFTLSLSILAIVGLMISSFFDFTSLYVVIILLIFLFSVHIRYCNYITFALGILALLFVYSRVFFAMITPESLFSTALFVFFLPLCIIWNTYFWREHFEHDFILLHYSSIFFSWLFSIYVIFWVGWWPLFFYVIATCIFLIGILFLLSYFRFRYH